MSGIGEQRQRAGDETTGGFDEHEQEDDDEGPADALFVGHPAAMAVAVMMAMAVMSIVLLFIVVMVIAVLLGATRVLVTVIGHSDRD